MIKVKWLHSTLLGDFWLLNAQCLQKYLVKIPLSFALLFFSFERSGKCINRYFTYFQGTLEKLDIQTETNNKLLAQQDKQQVSYNELNWNISFNVCPR